MIIKSEFKTFFFWFSNVCIVGGVYGFLYMITGSFFSNVTIKGYIALSVVLIILIGLYAKMLWDARGIVIDTNSKTILFKNRYTRKEKLYQFDFFDGYVTTIQTTKFGNFKVIYFVKNQVYMYKVSQAMYSNQPELFAALSPLKDLGLIKYSFTNSIRTLLGKKVLT